jgi:hypothetical protein
MNKPAALSLIVLCSSLLTGCTTLVTHRAKLDERPDGIRVYPPKIYLMVDTAERKSTLSYLPDYSRAYDVKPRTFLAQQDFKIELDEGQLKALTANQDTTALMGIIKDSAAQAAKAAATGVSSSVINGTFGLVSGIYRLEDDGVFRKLN